MPARDEARRQRALCRLPLLEREWLWRMNRRAVASGVAPGVFFGRVVPVAQTPFAAAVALLMRANLLAAAPATLVFQSTDCRTHLLAGASRRHSHT